jgi:hypothetical protein
MRCEQEGDHVNEQSTSECHQPFINIWMSPTSECHQLSVNIWMSPTISNLIVDVLFVLVCRFLQFNQIATLPQGVFNGLSSLSVMWDQISIFLFILRTHNVCHHWLWGQKCLLRFMCLRLFWRCCSVCIPRWTRSSSEMALPFRYLMKYKQDMLVHTFSMLTRVLSPCQLGYFHQFKQGYFHHVN